MRIGVILPHTGHSASADALRDVCTAAEELGFDGVWVGDHITLPARQETAYPYHGEDDDDRYEVPLDRPFLEPFATLGFAAALTARCTVGVSVTIVPYRPAALLVKLAGTLMTLSQGRLVLGAGAGWLREEFDALGADFSARGAHTDETLALLRTAWAADGPVTFDGAHVRLAEPMFLNPGTGLDPAPPVWIGGNGAVARRRTAQYGDVWHPHMRGSDPETIRHGLEDIERRAAGYGRNETFTAAIHTALVFTDDDGPDPATAGRLEGSPAFIARTLRAYAAAGVSEMVFSFGGGAARRVATMQRIAALRAD